MAYIKPDGQALTTRDRGALAIAHGLLTAEKVKALFKDKGGDQVIIQATNRLVHQLWGEGVFGLDTSKQYVAPVKVIDNAAELEWFRSRRVDR